ncbi:MAG: hypothetical protein RIQ81_899, partial [Pseudomonadota bacterium]
SAPWGIPLGSIPNYNYPIGSSIAFNDTFPWFAVLMKFVSPFLPAKAQVVGLWMLLNFVLQGVFGFLLVRSLGGRVLPTFAAACFFVTSPVFLFRFDAGHASLCAHWCVLAALWLAAKFPKGDAPVTGWVFLLFLAWSSHPYLGAMVLPIALVYSGRKLSTVAMRCTAMMLASILPLYLFGYLTNSRSNQDAGFHYFATDILAFFNPHDRSVFFRGPTRAGQYEGFAWLGAGMCALLLLELLDLFRRGESLINLVRKSRHRSLVLICLLMALFALGSNVRVWGNWIFQLEWFYEPLSFLTGPFRSGGRFVWPLYYLLFAGILIRMQKRWGSTAMVLMFAAFVCQVIDQYPVIASAQRLEKSEDFIELSAPGWDQLGGAFNHVALVPPHFEEGICGGDAVEYPTTYYAPFALFASQQGMTINSGPRARPPRASEAKYCEDFMTRLRHGVLERDTVYVVANSFRDRFKLWTRDSASCEALDGKMVCIRKQEF